MKKMVLKLAGIAAVVAMLAAVGSTAYAAKVEKVIMYENFGGEPVDGLTPAAWPAVHADSMASPDVKGPDPKDPSKEVTLISGKMYGTWRSRPEKVTNTVSYNANEGYFFPQVEGNAAFHLDSMMTKRTKLGAYDASVKEMKTLADLVIADTAKDGGWVKEVTMTNGSKINWGMVNVGSLPLFQSPISYDTVVAPWLMGQNNPGTLGYLVIGSRDMWHKKTITPTIVFPVEAAETLPEVTKLEVLFSGTRQGSNMNVLAVRVAKYTPGTTTLVGIDTFTFGATYMTRLITVPVDPAYDVRFYLEAYGQANNANGPDYLTKTNYTEVSGTATYNSGAFTIVDNNTNANVYSVKVYGLDDDGAGYAVNGGTASGDITAISPASVAYGEEVTITASSTKAEKVFVGWKISGREDLSEVANPLTLTLTENLTVEPVYGGDNVEVAVVNENFTNWEQKGKPAADAAEAANGFMLYTRDPNDDAIVANDIFTGEVKVPFRYGFTNGSKSELAISLNRVNVMPHSTTRVHNVPGADRWRGFVAFMGPNANKGYVSLDSIAGATKAVVEVSNYDLANYSQAGVGIKVNGKFVRNYHVQTLYAESVEIPFSEADNQLQVGWGNQSMMEHFRKADGSADPDGEYISTTIGARAMALHTLKVYATVAAPNLPYHKLSVITEGAGKVSFTPAVSNSDTMYQEATVVALSAATTPATDKYFYGWYDGETLLSESATYEVTMSEAKNIKAMFGSVSNVNTLDNLVVGEGTLSPVFNKDTLSYTVNVANSTDSVTITATPSDAEAEVVGDGKLEFTGESQPYTITVTAANDVVKTYTVTVIRLPASADATLDTLVVSAGTLTPAFSKDVFSYGLSVANSVSSITITATPNATARGVEGDGEKPLNEGANPFEIRVTAENGTDFQIYTVTVTRFPASADATLDTLVVSEGTLTPTFSKEVLAYTVNVANSVSNITITATPNETAKDVEGDGAKQLVVGENPFNIVVTAENDATKTYTVTVTRAQPTAVNAADMSATKLYPNPVATSELTLENEYVKAGEAIMVYDMNGSLVAIYEAAGETTTLNVSKLANGTYFVKVGKYTAKFVKQ